MSSSTADPGRRQQPEQSPDELRRDIESTREEMSETLEALGDKLSPQREIERGKERVREQAREAGSTVTARVQQVQRQVRGQVEQVQRQVRGQVEQVQRQVRGQVEHARAGVAAGAHQVRGTVATSDQLTPQRVAGGAGTAVLLPVIAAAVRRRGLGARTPPKMGRRTAAGAGEPSHTIARSLHDAGLAAWFGGALMGAVGLNGASREVPRPEDRSRLANAGWGRWTPVNAAAVSAHLLGASRLAGTDRERIAAQNGAPRVHPLKATLTTAALGASAYSGLLQRRMIRAEAEQVRRQDEPDGLPVRDATTPGARTPEEAAKAQERLRILQWLIPGLTGALIVVSARAGE